MEEQLKQLDVLVSSIEPVTTKKIENIENAAIIEYVRLEQYQEIKRIFEGSTLNPNFDLWLWINNLVTIPRVDPIFFSSSDDQNILFIDDMLLEDSDLAREQTTLANMAIAEISQINSELKTANISFGKLTVTEIDNDIVLKRRKVRGAIIKTGLVLTKEEYDYLESLLIPDIKDDKNVYIEMYLLRHTDKTLISSLNILSDQYYEQLASLGVNIQLFATPLQHYFDEYGSEYYDIDRYFGSFGSIMKDTSAVDRLNLGGSFEVNLIHYGILHNVIIRRLNEIVRYSKKKIVLYIVYDTTINGTLYEDMDTFAWSGGYSIKVKNGNKTFTRQFMILKSSKVPKNQPTPKQINAAFFALTPSTPNIASNKEEPSQTEPAVEKENRFERRTYPILYPYEKAVIIAERALHLSRGCPPKIKIPDGVTDPLLVAEMELEQKVMPMILPRMNEMWNVNELEDYDSGAHRY